MRYRKLAGVVALLAGAALGLSAGAGGSPTAAGTRLWAHRYNGPGNGSDIAYTIVSSPDGTRVFVTGASAGIGTSSDYATAAYDASSGAELWVSRFNGPGNGNDAPLAIAVSPDGTRVFVTGHGSGLAGGDVYHSVVATVLYDAATGAELWVAVAPEGVVGAGPPALAISPDGSRIFVTGSRDVGGSSRYATLAYDAATGALLWSAVGGGTNPSSIDVSPDGTTVVVSGSGYVTVAYDAATGTQLWTASLGGPGVSGAVALKFSPDGTRVFVTGTTDVFGQNPNFATVAYDGATGAQIWVSRYDGPAHDHDEVNGLAVSRDGAQVYVTGFSVGSTTNHDYATVALSGATGATLWARRYNGPANGDDYASSVAVSPDGTTVTVTGGSGPTGYPDYATITYAADGTTLWIRRYGGAGTTSGFAYATTFAPDGSRVFVTGSRWRSGTGPDYFTVAYSR